VSSQRERAEQDYMAGMKYKDLADKYEVTINTIKSWKQRYKWNRNKSAPTEQGCTQNKTGAPGEKDAPAIIEKIKEEAPDLTEKQVLFVAEYLTDFNATRAAMAVGYSKKTAGQLGWQLLQKPSIQAEIKRQTELVTYSLGITTQRVLLEYLKIAFSDIANFVNFGQKEILVGVDKKGNPVTRKVNAVDFIDNDQVDSTIIQEVRQGRGGVSIKLHDKMKALEKLEKYLDLLPDQHRRRVEEERLKLERERFEYEKSKGESPGDLSALERFIYQLEEIAGDENA